MAVVVIISIMVSVATPDVIDYIRDRKEKTLVENLGLLRQALAEFMQDHSENPKTYMLSGSFDVNNPSHWKDQVFFQDNDSSNDVHIAFPICLQQLVEDKYIMNIPNNPFTGEPDWHVRGFAEPKELPSSWLNAVNEEFYIDKNIFPRITANANKEPPVVLGIGNLVGIYDIRAGDDTNNYHADIDSWDERQDGKWQDFPNELKRIIARPNEFDINTNSTIDFMQLANDGSLEVVAYFIDGSQTLIDPSELKFDLVSGSGSFSTDGITYAKYTGSSSPEEAIIEVSYTDSSPDPKTRRAEITVNVTSVLDHITVDPLNFVVFTNSQYSMFNVIVTAHYLDGSTNIVTPNTEWQHMGGPGSIDESYNFVTDTTTGTATVKCIYEEADIVADSLVTIDVESELKYLTCLPADIEIKTGESVNLLAELIIAAHFNDGSMKNVTALVNWADVTGNPPGPGFGNLSGSTYTAPGDKTGTAVMRAEYSENGITKQIDFPIKVKRTLVAVDITPTSYTIKTGESINLNTLVDVKATYSEGTVLSDVEANWMHVSGVGSVSGSTFIADPAISGTANLLCVYSEDGVTITNNFTMTVKRVLEDLTLSSASTIIKTGESFDLSSLIATASYSDTTTDVVAPVWTRKTGVIGTLTGSVFTAPPDKSGTVVVEASYTDDGITETANFSITVKRVLSGITLSQDAVEMKTGESVNLVSIAITAHYTDGANQVVPADSYTIISGIGAMSGTVFVAPDDESSENYNPLGGPSIIEVSYSEDGVTKTNFISAIVHKVLTGIESDDNDWSMLANSDKNLEDFEITAHFTDNVDEVVTTSCEWSILSGAGTITGANFTSGPVHESPEVEVSYTYKGVTKKDKIIFDVKRTPTTLEITPEFFEVYTGDYYDLESNCTYTLHYSDGTSINLGVYDFYWSIDPELGGIVLPDYEAPEDYDEPGGDPNVVVCKAEYNTSINVDSGLVTFTLTDTISGTLYPIPELLVINPDHGTVLTSQTKDLNTIFTSTLYLTDGNSGDVSSTVVWSILSGPGSISGDSTFTAPNIEDTITLMGTHTFTGFDGTAYDITAEVRIDTRKYPIALILSTTSHTMDVYDNFDVDWVGVDVEWSDGSTTPTSSETWSHSGDGVWAPPDDFYSNIQTDGSAILTASYTDAFSGVTVTDNITITINLIPPQNGPYMSVDWRTDTEINIDWSYSSYSHPTPTSYNIYLDGTLIDTVSGSTFTYTFTGLSSNTWYDLGVAGVNDAGEGPVSTIKRKTKN